MPFGMPVTVCNGPEGICYTQPDSFLPRDYYFPDENPYVVGSTAWQLAHPDRPFVIGAPVTAVAGAPIGQQVSSQVTPVSAPALPIAQPAIAVDYTVPILAGLGLILLLK